MNKQEPTIDDIKKDRELFAEELKAELEADRKAYMVGIKEAQKMLIALKKAKKILKKEPDNPTVDDIINQCIDYIATHHGYMMGALNFRMSKELGLLEKTRNIEQKAKFINLLLKILTVAAL